MIKSKDNPRGIFFVPSGERTKEKISLANHLQGNWSSFFRLFNKDIVFFLGGGGRLTPLRTTA